MEVELSREIGANFDEEVKRLETQIKEGDSSYYEFWLSSDAGLVSIMKDAALSIQDKVSNEGFIYIVLGLGQQIEQSMERLRKLSRDEE